MVLAKNRDSRKTVITNPLRQARSACTYTYARPKVLYQATRFPVIRGRLWHHSEESKRSPRCRYGCFGLPGLYRRQNCQYKPRFPPPWARRRLAETPGMLRIPASKRWMPGQHVHRDKGGIVHRSRGVVRVFRRKKLPLWPGI